MNFLLVNSSTKRILYLFFTFCFLDAQNTNYIINNLVEKKGSFYNKMSNKPITGKLFFEFIDNKNIILLPVGKLVGGKKNGLWTRYWSNGLKKSQGFYFDSLKEGFWYVWSHEGSKYLEIKYKNNQLIHFTNCVIDICD